MTESVAVPGLGVLTGERGPGHMPVWQLQRPVISSAYREPIAVTMLLDGDDELDAVDWSVAVDVLSDIDRYLATGLRFVHTAMLTDPAWFGWAEDDRDRYRDVRTAQPSGSAADGALRYSVTLHPKLAVRICCDPVAERQPSLSARDPRSLELGLRDFRAAPVIVRVVDDT